MNASSIGPRSRKATPKRRRGGTCDMTQRKPTPVRRTANDGFIVIAVLWILGALAVLAAIYSLFVVDTAAAVASHKDRVQAEALVTAGIELAAHRITAV